MLQSDLVRQDVRGQLAALKLKIQGRLMFEGVAWVVLALVAAVFVTLGLDYALRLDRLLRGLLMLAAAGGLAAVVWRQMIWPLRVTMNDEDLALLVERRYGQLGDRLISALQFSKARDLPPGTSLAMIAQVGVEANELARKLPFEQVVERENLRRRLMLALCATVMLAGFSVWQGGTMGLWFKRNILFQDAAWPQDTYLKVSHPRGLHDFTVLRGDDLAVKVIADVRPGTDEPSIAPPYVVFHAYYSSVGATEERVDVNPDGRTYEKRFQAVSEEFRFYVTGGDDSRDKAKFHRVLLIDPPAMKDIEYSVTFPHYMGRSSAGKFDPVQGVLAVPLGGEVTFRATATKDLAAARMLLDDQSVGDMKIGPANPSDKRTVQGGFVVSGANKLAQRMLRFVLTDTDGYDNRRGQQLMIQVQPDLPPTVDFKTYGVGTNVTFNAEIPARIAARDDYGVAAARVGAILVRKATTQAASQPAPGPARTPATQATQAWGQMNDLDPAPDGRKDFKGEHRVDLEKLIARPGVGDVIAVAAEVQDTMDSSLGGPNKKTATLELKIVPSTEVEAGLVKRTDDLLLEFAQAILVQQTCVEKTDAASQETDANRMRMYLSESSAGQTAVGTQCAKASEQLQSVLLEMQCNRVFTADEATRMKDAIGLLNDEAAPINTAAAFANQAVKAVEALKGDKPDLAKVKDSAVSLLESQQRILKQLKDIQAKVLYIQSRQQLINNVNILKTAWDEATRKTLEARNEEIRKSLGTLPASGPAEPATNPAPRQ